MRGQVIKLFVLGILFLPAIILSGNARADINNEFSEYTRNIRQKIIDNIIFSQQTREQTKRRVITVSFTIDKEGNVERARIIKSSGSEPLDNAAIESVYRASPFPSPVQAGRESLQLTFSLELIPPRNAPQQPKKNLKDYQNWFMKKIESVLTYPPDAKEHKWEGIATLKVKINNSGTVEEVKVVSSSGYPILDKAAVEAVYHASPYPLPSSLKTPIILEISFSFRKKGERKMPPSSSGLEKTNLSLTPGKRELKNLVEKKKVASPKLEKLFKIGKENSLPLKVARGQRTLARTKVTEALRKLFPNVGVEYTSTEGQTITDPYKSKSYGLKFEHILYDSNQRGLSLKREKTNVEVAKINYQKEENELLFEILKAYYQLQGEKKNKDLLEILKNELDKDMELASALKEAGLITQIENLKIVSTYKKVESELASQLGKYRLAVANLKKALGIEPKEELPPLPDIDFKDDIPLEKSLKEYRNIGFTQRPEVLLWEKSIEATKLGLRVAKVENRPKLLLESFWGKSGEAYGWQPLELGETWNVNAKVVWLFGGSSFETGYTQEKTVPTEITEVSTKTEANTVSFKTNILDKIKYYSQVQEGKVALKQAEDELVKLKKDIAWEIEEGFSTYTEGKEELKSSQEERTLRKQELELKKTLFKAGEIELSELIEAKFRLTEAEISLVKAKLKMYLGIILLDKATGFNLNLIEKL